MNKRHTVNKEDLVGHELVNILVSTARKDYSKSIKIHCSYDGSNIYYTVKIPNGFVIPCEELDEAIELYNEI